MQIPPTTSLLHALGGLAQPGAAPPVRPPQPAAPAAPVPPPQPVRPPPAFMAQAQPQPGAPAQPATPPANLPRGSLLNITV